MSLLQLEVRGPVWYWRGPAPHHFVTVPTEASDDIAEIAGEVTYGWGMIPVELRLGGSRWTTSLWPKDGQYIVPLKAAVRARSEEHTSELQSRGHLVCRLLLEKKK